MVLKHIHFKGVRCLRVESWLFLLSGDGTAFILPGVSNINQYQPEILMDPKLQLEHLRVFENHLFIKQICSNNTCMFFHA